MGQNYAANGEDAELEMEPMMKGEPMNNSNNAAKGENAAAAKKFSTHSAPERDKWQAFWILFKFRSSWADFIMSCVGYVSEKY